jgi:hypothetical protein
VRERERNELAIELLVITMITNTSVCTKVRSAVKVKRYTYS